MKIISLAALHPGYACSVADYLNKHKFKNEYERDFFDYITVSMKSINEVLNNKIIEFDDKELPNFPIPNNSSNIFIRFKHFDNMISYHDFTDMQPDSYKCWTHYYKEQQKKLINDIISNNTIVFVRFCVNQSDLIESDIYEFFKNITCLNPKLDYYLILFSTDILTISLNLSNNMHFFNLNFKLWNDSKTYTNNIYHDLINYYDTKCFNDIINIIKITRKQ